MVVMYRNSLEATGSLNTKYEVDGTDLLVRKVGEYSAVVISYTGRSLDVDSPNRNLLIV
jgi:hypothetical protein